MAEILGVGCRHGLDNERNLGGAVVNVLAGILGSLVVWPFLFDHESI
jgi:hypothetical protein